MSCYFNQLSKLFLDILGIKLIHFNGFIIIINLPFLDTKGHHKGQVVGFELFGVLEAPLAWLQDDGSRQPRDATGQVDDTWVERKTSWLSGAALVIDVKQLKTWKFWRKDGN